MRRLPLAGVSNSVPPHRPDQLNRSPSGALISIGIRRRIAARISSWRISSMATPEAGKAAGNARRLEAGTEDLFPTCEGDGGADFPENRRKFRHLPAAPGF